MVESIKKQIKDLKDIKSIYTINVIFSFLEENHKLNMAINNKQLQQKFGLDIQYYKNKSGKYKIGKKNGIGKEYELDSNELIFEGEYLNGKKNGKGKEYYTDVYQGKYLNGKIYKKEYYSRKNKLKFEGEYLNGKRNGIGKEYYDGDLIFFGEYLNGERWNGKGYKTDKNDEKNAVSKFFKESEFELQ